MSPVIKVVGHVLFNRFLPALMSTEYEFSVTVSADRLLAMYRGDVHYLVVRARNGLTLQLPLSNFRQYVDENGLSGLFRVTVDEHNKIKHLTRLAT